MTARTLFIEGVALWAPHLPGWEVARSAFRGEGAPVTAQLRRPIPELLPPAAEASEICKRIEEMNGQFDALQSASEESIRTLMERRTALISAAVTGQIDVRSPVEPAAA